ncbi:MULTISPECIES: hypothetical protein [unclassified Roseateles]|uniref:hypothetical protein n=1 Tax=unclassified Roseateles TaxID=2626991 RepID=UPI0006F765D5|nr:MULTISPECIES: hypothetical protein [unclassified Roseateles]KQW51948.1 hypothetical protein ASC81_04910 [Pelomonas sp. Root405]KRA78181.1 hypothetical protein ASD88_04915 [Pelomonas sp. Root662]
MVDATPWWQLLCAIAGLNLIIWTASTAWLHRNRPDGTTWPHQRLQLLLSALYVLGCGYRSFLPVFDVPRVVMVDSWASSVLVGRTVATIAELSFAAQWALLLRGAALATGQRFSLWVAYAVVPLIAIAEINSWYAVLTTRNIGHVVEEVLWGTAAVLTVVAMGGLWPQATARGRRWLAVGLTAGVLYAAYMFFIDVPMYWARWVADEAAGRSYTTVAAGVADAASRWHVSHDWAHWRSEVVWMTLYFSVAVWISIGLAHVRLPLRARPPAP